MKTDEELHADIMAELKWEPSIATTQIGVQVRDGLVTLTGQVGSHAEKWDAERAVQRVEGVRALAIEIDVAVPGASLHRDADIARSAENVLAWLTYLPKGAVKVMVEGGWITLSGEVAWEYQRQAAAKSVRYLTGVTGVSDHIVIRPHGQPNFNGPDIELALKRRLKADTPKLLVQIDGGLVILSGSVRSWYERELAKHTAWGTPGVLDVIDHITVMH